MHILHDWKMNEGILGNFSSTFSYINQFKTLQGPEKHLFGQETHTAVTLSLCFSPGQLSGAITVN